MAIIFRLENPTFLAKSHIFLPSDGENLLEGGREGDDLRHRQENLWNEVNFEFQKKTANFSYVSLSCFNLIML